MRFILPLIFILIMLAPSAHTLEVAGEVKSDSVRVRRQQSVNGAIQLFESKDNCSSFPTCEDIIIAFPSGGLDSDVTLESPTQSGILEIQSSTVDITSSSTSTNLSPSKDNEIFTNDGATGTITFTLPELTASNIGTKITAINVEAELLNIAPGASDQIMGFTDAVGDRVQSNNQWDSIILVGVSASEWVPLTSTSGVWADIN